MPTELKRLTCVCCGGQLEEKDGKLVCKYCKNTFTEVEKISEEEVVALNRATTDRNLLRFDEALEEYSLLLKKYPDNEAGNWGALLCDYGIIYEQDYNGEYIPTCHRLNERPVVESSYYAKLNAEHKENAGKIEKLRLSIMQKAKKIQPYDVFICYKATEEKHGVNVPTRESKWARDIYDLLTKKGLRVFFAEKSLAGSNIEYEPHIYAALRSAKLMFVLAGSIEHVNSTWVANEWKRYAKYIRDGEEKTLRVVYDNIEPYNLPKELQVTQAIDHNDIGWDEAVQTAADSIFETKQETPEWQKAMEEMRLKMAGMQTTANEGGAVLADKYCSKCFVPNVKSAKFCGECGNKDFIVAPDGVKYCAECGTANQIKQKFCLSCGNNKFVYTKEDYQKEVERRERERKAEEERKERERLAAKERARQEAERRERERIAEEERKERERIEAEKRAKEEAERRELERIEEEKRKAKERKISVIVSLLVAVIVAFIIAITSIDSCVRDDLTLELSSNGGYYIVTDCPEDKTEAVIPEKYNGKPVKEIGSSAFSYCNSLTSVKIPDSVTSIGSSAFYNCSSLKSVTIGKGVKTIGSSAFMDCSSLISVTIPDSVTSIGSRSFYHCSSLTKVTIGNSVTSIGEEAFFWCDDLTNITIPDSVITIGVEAFYNCNKLTSITMGKGVTSIGGDAFFNCDNLTSVYISDIVAWCNISFEGTPLHGAELYLNNNKVTALIIPNGVKTIGDSAFSSCDSLTSVTIPGSVTRIGSSAFYNCSSLKSVTIGKGVKTIGDSAFSSCDSLTSVTIPNSVTSIGFSAFSHCSSLTSITIPDSVTSIGNSAFFHCSSLTSIKIPDSVTSIGDHAFDSCSSLTSIIIPDSVTSIGYWAFEDCSSLTSIHFNGTKEQWGKIEKGYGWQDGTPTIKVVCTDGTP